MFQRLTLPAARPFAVILMSLACISWPAARMRGATPPARDATPVDAAEFADLVARRAAEETRPRLLADLLYEAALERYVIYRRGVRTDRAWRKRIADDLERAVEWYEVWLEKHPDDEDASERRLMANMILYSQGVCGHL